MRIRRYLTHAVMLVIAAAISGYSSAPYLSSGLGAVRALAANSEGSVGDVLLGGGTTIIKPLDIPTSALTSHSPIVYTVEPGDTLDSIARAFDTPFREITWSNPGVRVPLKPGLVLYLPPVPGVVVEVRRGETLASLASTYGVDPSTILDFNRVRGPLRTGSILVIPIDPQHGPVLSTGAPADPIAPGQLLCPIQGAKIIQKFGPTSFALEPPFDGYLHFHTGVDLLAVYGTPISAAAGGRVTAVGLADYFGLRVEITDSYGLVEIYAHMEQVAGIYLGEPVQQGQMVGFVGSTGLSVGSHLHFQLEVGGMPTDPLPLVGC